MDALDAPAYTLRQLSFLVCAADEGTVAGAAARLHVSSSAVSDALSELERALGAQLTVRRRARGLSLTSTGVEVVARARALLAQSRELESSLRGAPGELVGPITIGCYPTLAPTILPPLLQGFGAAHPRVELDILEATHDRLEGRLESGQVDVAFIYDTLIPGEPQRAKLFELPAHVVVAADDPLATGGPVRLEDLVERDLILLDAPPSSEHTLSLFSARGLTPRVRHRVQSYEAVRTLVGRGLGYGILVQRPANEASYEGYRVVMQEITPAVRPVGIDVIWSASREPTQRTRALIDYARSLPWPQPR
ncbi:LysR family transcriptional regulator [Agrococcus baldri]|uniref:Transcriptional regulator n=1 Tax=Agrococcus baldri TaxID=153730 RepID=A0AA87UX85_9MICO|nr:LysR family transcriptional regulator [Agrococcus baldri]GEK80162.1 transcriptional regulator [Agrococcus baldri]